MRASLYIIVCSARNRAARAAAAAARAALPDRRHRRRRLLLLRVLRAAARAALERGARRGARGEPPARRLPALGAPGRRSAASALLVVAALSWLLPFDSGLLEFSEAETQFLFPAPVSRRQLLVHRLLRSQIGLLFGALIIGVTIAVGRPAPTRLRARRSRSGCCSLTGEDLFHRRHAGARAAARGSARPRAACAWLPLVDRSARRRDCRRSRWCARSSAAPPSGPSTTLVALVADVGAAAAARSCCGRSWRWCGRCSPTRLGAYLRRWPGALVVSRPRRVGAPERRGVPGRGRQAADGARRVARRRRSRSAIARGRAAGRSRRPAAPKARSSGRRRCRRCASSTGDAMLRLVGRSLLR